MAYQNLNQVKLREIPHLLSRETNYQIQPVDRESSITLATLVGGNIVPVLSNLTHLIAERAGANLYIYGADSGRLSVADAQRLRIEPIENYRDQPLEKMLRSSFAVFIADERGDPNPQIYITGENVPLAQAIDNALVHYVPPNLITLVAGTPSQQGANKSKHPANRYTTERGVEIQFSQGILADLPDAAAQLANVLAQAILGYVNAMSTDQIHEALRPRSTGVQGRIENFGHDFKRWAKRLPWNTP